MWWLAMARIGGDRLKVGTWGPIAAMHGPDRVTDALRGIEHSVRQRIRASFGHPALGLPYESHRLQGFRQEESTSGVQQ